jgi:hypothetical protein
VLSADITCNSDVLRDIRASNIPERTSRSGATRGCRGNCVALREEVTTPAVLPAVSYRGVRPWQRGGAEPSAQRIRTLRDGSSGASQRCDCQHQGGWGPGARGRVNPGEPS